MWFGLLGQFLLTAAYKFHNAVVSTKTLWGLSIFKKKIVILFTTQ